MRWLALLLYLAVQPALAQTSAVRDGELQLDVTVADSGSTPFTREMVMITIRGTYRRHITRETLEQPPMAGLNWMQLGPDEWHEETVRGRPVKIFERRMALFPEASGELEIGPFVHHLTLTDEEDDWFDHSISSAPVHFRVDPAPAGEGWWFPVRSLKISDHWSNAPDQLAPGEGVLRTIRIEAVGASPEMIPPMPELTSPSAMIFPHPEKRLVELSPEGPITYAFWRWTVRPTNGASAVLEPIRLPFYDTRNRVARMATISAQRVAFEAATLPPPPRAVPEAALPGAGAALAAALAFAVGLAAMLAGQVRRRARPGWADPLAWRLRRRARAGDAAGVRRAAADLQARDGATAPRAALLSRLDSALFGRGAAGPDLTVFARDFLSVGRQENPAPDTNG